MLFELLKVNNVRNITGAHIEPGKLLNIIVGPNASGKTALLEAIHILARARSFRTPRINDVVQYNTKALQVVAEIRNAKNTGIRTGIEKSHGTTLIRYNGSPVKTVSRQASYLPLVFISPDSHALITGSPKLRRHWLDWAMFHVEQNYLSDWRNYHKALKNRNILLKKGGSNQQFSSWEKSMLDAAAVLECLRIKFMEKLQQQLAVVMEHSFAVTPQISFDKGYTDLDGFEQYLLGSRKQDKRLGYTRLGPHKADIDFRSGQHKLAQLYSRGQIKRFVTLFLLAQARTYELINGEKPVFLIDDFAAELDQQARSELLASVLGFGSQVFLTSTQEDEVFIQTPDTNMFHVERGNFNKVVK